MTRTTMIREPRPQLPSVASTSTCGTEIAEPWELLKRSLLICASTRASGDYGGFLYKSDYHYAWMNALVAHAFGLAVTGRAGAAHNFPIHC